MRKKSKKDSFGLSVNRPSMELWYGRAKSKVELGQILELQQSNLLPNVAPKERKNEGYVTVLHTLELLAQMNDTCAHIIAKDADKIVGYALCMHPKFADRIEVLKPMFTEINAVVSKNYDYMVMGQICIEKAYRKRGVFRSLYRSMKEAVRSEYDAIITEVDAQNTRLLQAHYAVGFEDLKIYRSGRKLWHLMLLATAPK